MDKQMIYQSGKKDPEIMWILFILLGWSYGSLGQIVKQIFYYITLGGLGFWAIYRFFTLNKVIRQYNKELAVRAGFSSDDLIKYNIN